jgi:acylphosphatase
VGDTARIRLRVEGRVQGVGFRWFTRDRAVALGLTGFVRNLPDGAVEAVAEGSAAALDAWIRHVRSGPTMSRVLTFSVEASTEPMGEYDAFDILH